MTDYEKSQIRQLQEKGYGYKKIAKPSVCLLTL